MIKKDSKIYVAGHSGLIGSAIVKKLINDGYTQILTVSHSDLDLNNASAVSQYFKEKQPEYVILAAGIVGGIAANINYPATFILKNLAIQLNVFQAALDIGVRKLLFYGSSCMYPLDSAQPMPESSLLTGKPEPSSLFYAIAKLAGIGMCQAINRQHKTTSFLSLIPNNVYGPNDNFNQNLSHVLPALISKFHNAKKENCSQVKLWGTGSAKREFVFSEDLAEISIELISRDINAESFPMNISRGEEVSISELASIIADVVGYQGHIVWDDTKPIGAQRKLLDPTNLRNHGLFPKTELKAGITATYDWYINNSPST
jgi:GDP-L-fucose synthase